MSLKVAAACEKMSVQLKTTFVFIVTEILYRIFATIHHMIDANP